MHAISSLKPYPASLHCHGQIYSYTLDNGLRLIVQRDGIVPLVACHLRYEVGSRHEPDQQHGIAHLLEHLMFQGSSGFPKGRHAETVWRAGGWANAATNHDSTAFFQSGSPEFLHQFLELEADRMCGLDKVIVREDIATQLRIIAQERSELYAPSFADSTDLILESSFPAWHPYCRQSIGNPAHLEQLTIQDIVDFYQLHYRPTNAILAIVGDVDPDHVASDANETLGNVAPAKQSIEPTTAVPLSMLPLASPARARVLVRTPPGHTDRFYATLHTPPAGVIEHDAVMVLAAFLGQGRGSRLFQELVRGTSLAQPSQDMARAWTLEVGNSLLLFVVSAAPRVRLSRLVEAFTSGLASAVDRIDDSEVRRASALVARSLADALDSPQTRAAKLTTWSALTGHPELAYAQVQRVQNLSSEDLREAARCVLAESNPSIVGYSGADRDTS